MFLIAKIALLPCHFSGVLAIMSVMRAATNSSSLPPAPPATHTHTHPTPPPHTHAHTYAHISPPHTHTHTPHHHHQHQHDQQQTKQKTTKSQNRNMRLLRFFVRVLLFFSLFRFFPPFLTLLMGRLTQTSVTPNGLQRNSSWQHKASPGFCVTFRLHRH